MRCNKAQEYLSLEMDGVLPPEATVDLQDHLDSCMDCREYRQDIHLGNRLLAATEPKLSDNFEWKLQLRLNQTLKEAAGEVAFPWSEQPADRWGWFRNFGAATAMGLAAVLALAVFLGPLGEPTDSRSPVQSQILGSDRLPLDNRLSMPSGLGRPVSAISPFQQNVPQSRIIDRGWSGQNLEDLRTINRLKAENEKLGKMVIHSQRQLQMMRAQLDSTDKKSLDLHQESK